MNKKPLKKSEVIDILQNIRFNNLGSEIINLFDAENRFFFEPIVSSINLPPFKNSAVDGYAIHDDDVGKKNNLKLNHRIVAGENKNVVLLKGEIARIFTGAKMPENSNTVVMQENTYNENNIIKINKNPEKGENCRLAGEDVKKNRNIN